VSGSRAEIDWAAIRERLARATSATGAMEPNSPEARRLLDDRARKLAEPLPEQPRAGETLLVVTFALAGERYAIEARWVREITRFVDFTPVPGSAGFLVGVTNLRGEIVAVFNLRRFFGLSDTAVTDLSRVVVIGEDRNEFGILADQVHDIRSLREKDVLEPPGSTPSAGRPYVRGVTRDALIVLDGTRLLRDERLYIDQGHDSGRELPHGPG
jgi:purine-binding chemotaxis protein CheW